MNSQSISLLGLRVDTASKEEILHELDRTIQDNKKKVIVYVNAHGANLAASNSWLTDFYNRSDIVYADGQGIRLAAKMLKKEIPPHLPLTEWVWDILSMCNEKKYTLFVLGGTQETVEAAAMNISEKYPDLRIAGKHHGYFQKDGKEADNVIQYINTTLPNLLLVGFGMPVQEEWLNNTIDKLHVNVAMTAGGCIDVLAGKRVNVPTFLRRIGLEWLVRLLEEPGRLFTRYVIGNPKFILRVLAEKFNAT